MTEGMSATLDALLASEVYGRGIESIDALVGTGLARSTDVEMRAAI